MKILFLSRWFPYPVNNGSKLRIYNLLRGLSQYHDVSLISFVDQRGENPDAPEMREISSTIRIIPWREFDPKTVRARLGTFGLKPRSIVDTFSSEMAQAITETLNGQDYDLVIASQLQMAAYFPYFQNVPALLEELEVGLFHDQAFSADGKLRIRQALTWFKLRIYLSTLLKAFQACTTASAQERQLLVQNFPDYRRNIEIIPNCLNVDEYKNIQAEKKTNTLIFTGSFKYHTNYDAMLWFIRNVFPLVLNRIPSAQLIITGDHANLPLPSLKNITLAGHVEDIKSLIASCSISIAPLWGGGGTRLKILEAMALGIPIVSTSKGAEGLDVINNEHILLADTPEEFSEHVVRLLADDDMRQRLVETASVLVQEKYNWKIILTNYLRLVDTIVQ